MSLLICVRMKKLVPVEYAKNKDVEKSIYKEHSILHGTTELNAKFRYVQLVRSLKTYGTTFFIVTVRYLIQFDSL